MAPADTYNTRILDHYRHPRNFGTLIKPSHRGYAATAACGDEIHIAIDCKKSRIRRVVFFGSGCALALASASLLTEWVNGKTLRQIRTLTRRRALQLLAVPVSQSRRRCALLAFDALSQAVMKLPHAGHNKPKVNYK